jgi:hypothetical protein
MKLREYINNHSGLAAVVVALIIAVACYVTYSSITGNAPKLSTSGWYTDDDGKTWFADSQFKAVPFDHNGKPAFTAAVFKCGNGQPFVPFVTRFSPKYLKEAQGLEQSKAADARPKFQALQQMAMEIKKVGDSAWYSVDSPAGQKIMADGVKCTGGGEIEPVQP